METCGTIAVWHKAESTQAWVAMSQPDQFGLGWGRRGGGDNSRIQPLIASTEAEAVVFNDAWPLVSSTAA